MPNETVVIGKTNDATLWTRKMSYPFKSNEMRRLRILRRELLDHVTVLNEEHLKRLLEEYFEEYYHVARPHHGLEGETPFPTDKPDPIREPSKLVSIQL